MPVFEVTDPISGKTIELTGDSAPTERELEEIFAQYQQRQEKGIVRSAIDAVSEAFTGSDRETRATRDLPELSGSGLLSSVDATTLASITPALSTMSDPQEIAKTLSQIPEIGIQYDEKGNIIAANNKTGARAVLNKPGFSVQDLLSGVQTAAIAAPAMAAGGVLPAMAATGALSTATQGLQAASGGTFNPEDVAIDTLTAGVFEGAPAAFKALSGRSAGAAEIAAREAAEAEAARVGQRLSPESQAAQQTELLQGLAKSSEQGPQAATAAVETAKPKFDTMRETASQVAIDPERLAAAKRLGIDEKLMPSQLSRNQQYIEIEQGLASVPGSLLSTQQKDSIKAVAQTADDLITEFGGAIDKGELSERIRSTVAKSIDDLDLKAGEIYDTIDGVIPKKATVNAESIADKLKSQADDLGGVENLDPLERKILKIANSNPTYALIDKERKAIGQAMRKATGPYKDADSSSLKRLYSMLTDAQEGAASEYGASEAWGAAKAMVAQRKQLEEASIKLMGKELSGAIMPQLGAAVKRLSSGDFKKFDEMIAAIPKPMRQEAVVSALNDAFTAGSRAEKQLSPAGFVDWYSSLARNPAVMRRVSENLPDGAMSRLNDIYTVSKGVRDATKERITTGRITSLFDNLNSANGTLAKMYGIGKKVATAEGATSALGFPGAGTIGVAANVASASKKDPLTKSADALLSSPQFKAAAIAYADDSFKSKAKMKIAEKALERSAQYQRWLSLMPSEAKRKIAQLGAITYLSDDRLP